MLRIDWRTVCAWKRKGQIHLFHRGGRGVNVNPWPPGNRGVQNQVYPEVIREDYVGPGTMRCGR